MTEKMNGYSSNMKNSNIHKNFYRHISFMERSDRLTIWKERTGIKIYIGLLKTHSK
jgi:hypothetical protein